jgi:ribosomal protein S18 acetylase RimI-like enzyme
MKYGVGPQDAGQKGSWKDVATLGAQMLPGSDIAREVGASDLEPTISEDIKNKRYMDALLKAISTAGDVGTGTGAIMMGTGAGAVPGAALIGASQLAKLAAKMARKARVPYKQNYPDEKLIYHPHEKGAAYFGRQYTIPNTDNKVGIAAIEQTQGKNRWRYLIGMPDPNTGKPMQIGEMILVHDGIPSDPAGKIEKLISIDILPEFRKTGIGTQIVQGLKYYASNKKGLEIRDIKRPALKWWRNQGLVDEKINKHRPIKRPDGFIRNPDNPPIETKNQGGMIMRDPYKREERFI